IEPIIDVDKQKEMIDNGTLKEDFEFDMAGIMANKLKYMLTEVTENTNKVALMNESEKAKLGAVFFTFLMPIYKTLVQDCIQLMQVFPYDLYAYTQSIAQDEHTKRLYVVLKEQKLQYPEQLQTTLNKLKEKTETIHTYLCNNNYTFLQQDFRHYIFNSHNLVLEKCYGYLGQAIAESTGITHHMTGKGYKGIARPYSYDFDLIGNDEIPNTISTKRIIGKII